MWLPMVGEVGPADSPVFPPLCHEKPMHVMFWPRSAQGLESARAVGVPATSTPCCVTETACKIAPMLARLPPALSVGCCSGS